MTRPSNDSFKREIPTAADVPENFMLFCIKEAARKGEKKKRRLLVRIWYLTFEKDRKK